MAQTGRFGPQKTFLACPQFCSRVCILCTIVWRARHAFAKIEYQHTYRWRAKSCSCAAASDLDGTAPLSVTILHRVYVSVSIIACGRALSEAVGGAMRFS